MASIRWAAQAANDGSGTPTVTKGVGTANGDRLVAIVINDETVGDFSAVAPAWGAALSTSSEVADTPKGKVYEQKVSSAGTLPASWTFTPSGFVATTAWVFCIQDLDDDAELVISWANGTLPASPAGSRLVTAPSISGYDGADPILLTAHACIVSYANPTYSTPAGMDARGAVADADWMSAAAFSDELTGTGATGAKSSQISLTTAYKWRAVAVAIPTVLTATIEGSAAAPLGGLTATTTGEATTPFGAASAPLGGLAAAAAGDVIPPLVGHAAADLGPLTATADGVRGTAATTAAAPLGGLSVAAAAVVTRLGHAAAPLGALVAATTGVRTTFGTAAANLGGLVARVGRGYVTSALGATGGVLNPSIWLVDEDTDTLTPLPYWRDLVVAPVDGEGGELSVTIPAGAPGFQTLYDRVSASPQRDALAEVWLDGRGGGPARLRGRLYQKAGDDLRVGADWVFGGHFREHELGEVVVGPQDTETKELVFTTTVTPGTVLATAFDLARDRSAAILPGWSRDFTTTHDSAGQEWDTALSNLAYSPETTVLDVAQDLRQYGSLEFAATPDGVLQAWNYGTRGVDRSAGGAPVRLQHGANLAQADRRESSRGGEAATAVLGKGAEGQYQWAVDPTAEAERGRRVEVVADVGNFTSAGQVLAGAEGQLALLKTGSKERNHGLTFGDGHPVPLIDFGIGDYIRSATVGEPWARLRVRQWRLQFSGPGAERTGDVVAGDMIADWEDRIAARLSAIRRGGAKVGTSTPSPSVDDGKSPAAPEDVLLNTDAYPDADGATWASLSATWSPVTTNEDATATDDVVGYIVQFRYTGGGSLPAGWITVGQVQDAAADWDNVVADQAVAVRVAAINRYDRVGPWSDEEFITSGKDITAPPTPSTPVADSYLGILTGYWNGLGSAGELMPGDFSHVEMHASLSSGFTADRPLNADGSLDEDASTTYVDRLFAAGTMPSTVGSYGDKFYVVFVAVDRSNNASEQSEQDSATLTQAGDGDIGSLSIGKLSAGIMSAIMTLSGIIRTATTGSRVELDADGIRCYLGSAVVFQFDIPSSLLSIVGKLTSGAGVGIGPTIVVDPASPPAIRMYPTATQDRFEIEARTTERPNGATAAGFAITGRNAAGQPNGLVLSAWSTNVWLTQLDTSGTQIGGAVKLQQSGQAYLTNGDDSAYIQVDDDGSVQFIGGPIKFIGPPSGVDRLFANVPFGEDGVGFSFIAQDGSNQGYRLVFDDSDSTIGVVQNGSNAYMELGGPFGAYKSFVIPHPLDPEGRWLVHACTESPAAGVEYWGEVELVDGYAEVQLPDYFEALTAIDGRTVQVTMVLPDEPITVPAKQAKQAKVKVPFALPEDPPPPPPVPERLQVHPVAASRPRDGRFRIVSSAPDGTVVAWLVKAVRGDVPPLEVEPRRDEVVVAGDGPYRYVAGAAQPAEGPDGISGGGRSKK